MNKCMLVGAVGLALAGVTTASDTLLSEPRVDAHAFTQARDMVLGEPGSQHRAALMAQLRADIAAGRVDPREVVFMITDELLPNYGGGVSTFNGGIEGGGPQLGDNAPHFDDFSGYNLTNFSNPPGSLVGLAGQSNPAGIPIAATASYGAATDAVMMTVPMGQPGGVPPATASASGEPYGVFARRSAQTGLITAFALGMNYFTELLVPGDDSVEGHMRISTDWYLLDEMTSNWWSPVGSSEGFVQDRVFFGGTELGGTLGAFENNDNVLDRFASLGTLPGNFTIGQFFAHPNNPNFPFPTDQWFSMMSVLALNPAGGIGYGLFVKTEDTIANGVMDPRMMSGDIVPVDKDPVGWLNTYPGIEDDPGTPGVLEGIGLAQTRFAEEASTTGAFGLAPLLAAISGDLIQFGIGLDPLADVVPGFEADDSFIDNIIFKGEEFQAPEPLPDFIIPYFDDLESYTGGEAIRIQTDRWFDSISSNAVISIFQNTTPGGSQSIAQQNINNDNLFREEFSSALPIRVLPTLGENGEPFDGSAGEAPLEFEARIRIGGSTRTGRALRLIDPTFNSNFPATIIFGATDPTGAFAQSDGRVWIRQPNIGSNGIWGTPPGFDINEDSEANLVQSNWIPEVEWTFPPLEDDGMTPRAFNTEFINVRAGASGNAMGQTYNTGTFTPLRVEILPNPNQDPLNQFDEGVMRVWLNGTELFPEGDSSQMWIASSFTSDEAQFWSSNNQNGQLDTIHVDDLSYDGPLRDTPDGPDFVIPYMDGFELYNRPESITAQGSTPFLSIGSVPDNVASDNARKLTVLDSNPEPLVDGVTNVCRYEVTQVLIPGGPLQVGDVVALSHDALPEPFNTFLPTNLDCPGVEGNPTRFVMRPGENMPRVQEGRWALLNQDPIVYDASAGDIEDHAYSFTTVSRWGAFGNVADAQFVDDPTGAEGANAVMQIEVLADADRTIADFPMFATVTSILPRATASGGAFPTPETVAVMEWDLFIESLNTDGDPDDSLAPRSRFQVQVVGGGGNAGRITNVMFGGPDVNAQANLQDQNPPVGIIPADEISYAVPSDITSPDIQYESTGVSVLNGGLGIAGPLVNSWFRTRITVDQDSSWELSIDENRDGNFVVVATGTAIDAGLPGIDGITQDTTSIDAFLVSKGSDLGSGGSPVPSTVRIRTFAGPSGENWDAVGPSNADPNDDYCFYRMTTPEFSDDLNPVQIAAFVAADETFNTVRNLAADDIIAVLNREVDGSNMVTGDPIFDDCPFFVSSGFNQVEIFDGVNEGATVQFRGRWNLLGQAGQAGVNDPPPPGGITRPAGPSQMPPLPYNDFTAEPPGFPQPLGARNIVLAKWGSDEMDANNGVDPTPAVFPRSKWFIDNLLIDEEGEGQPCANLGGDPDVVDGADLAVLLAQWNPQSAGTPMTNPFAPADFNQDGFVNGADLAVLLANWGPCP